MLNAGAHKIFIATDWRLYFIRFLTILLSKDLTDLLFL